MSSLRDAFHCPTWMLAPPNHFEDSTWDNSIWDDTFDQFISIPEDDKMFAPDVPLAVSSPLQESIPQPILINEVELFPQSPSVSSDESQSCLFTPLLSDASIPANSGLAPSDKLNQLSHGLYHAQPIIGWDVITSENYHDSGLSCASYKTDPVSKQSYNAEQLEYHPSSKQVSQTEASQGVIKPKRTITRRSSRAKSSKTTTKNKKKKARTQSADGSVEKRIKS